MMIDLLSKVVGPSPLWNFQHNGESGLANEKKVFFPIDCKWLMELLGVDLEGLNPDMETYQEN